MSSRFAATAAATAAVMAMTTFGGIRAAHADGYSAKEVYAAADELGLKISMTMDKRQVLLARLNASLQSIVAKQGGSPILGVFAYQVGEGGFVLKVKKGNGLMRWKFDGRERNIHLSSYGVGAMIGGSSEWGARQSVRTTRCRPPTSRR